LEAAVDQCLRRIVLFTATLMIGNERVELMLFDTTGQVMIAALGSLHSILPFSLCPIPAITSAYSATWRRDLAPCRESRSLDRPVLRFCHLLLSSFRGILIHSRLSNDNRRRAPTS